LIVITIGDVSLCQVLRSLLSRLQVNQTHQRPLRLARPARWKITCQAGLTAVQRMVKRQQRIGGAIARLQDHCTLGLMVNLKLDDTMILEKYEG